jgi:hypothetical protein
LTIDKQEQYKIIKAVHEGKMNKNRAVIKLSIKGKLIAAEQAHSRRPRAAYFGDLIQIDASLHRVETGRYNLTLHGPMKFSIPT